MKQWIFLVGAIISEVVATLSLKAGMDNSIFYIVVLIGYVLAFVFLTKALKSGMALGVAYGIWGACGVAMTAFLSHLIFNEPLTSIMVLGIVVIIAGVLMIELGYRLQLEKRKETYNGLVISYRCNYCRGIRSTFITDGKLRQASMVGSCCGWIYYCLYNADFYTF